MKENSITFNNAVLTFVKKQEIKHVILVALWNGYGFQNDANQFRTLLTSTATKLQQAGATVWIMLQVPTHKLDIPRALARAALTGQDISKIGVKMKDYEKRVSFQRAMFTMKSSGINVLDPSKYLVGENGHTQVAADGYSLYSDNHHLSTHGAMKIAPMFQSIFTDNTSQLGNPHSE